MESKLVEKELSFTLTGICYQIHNKLGRFLTERQYSDAVEASLKENNFRYTGEPLIKAEHLIVGRPDFIVEDKIIIDLKAKKFVTKDDYNQMMKYLTLTGLELGLIVNFHASYLKPKRVLNYLIHSEHSDDH